MEEEASRINQGQTLGENSLPAGQSGGRKHGELSLERTSKDSKNAKRRKKKVKGVEIRRGHAVPRQRKGTKRNTKKKETLTNRQELD